MMDNLVSIIMPSWNTAQFIAESIQSVINQTYKNWELLIVDDCSTDDTCNFDREQNFTKILHEKTTADRLI